MAASGSKLQQQPLPKHYNGLGLVKPTASVHLKSETFDQIFLELWNEHVDFGTSRSHKKLMKTDREPLEWKRRLISKRQDQSKRAEGTTSSTNTAERGEKTERGKAVQTGKPKKTAPAKTLLPNRGRWGGTMAASLLTVADTA